MLSYKSLTSVAAAPSRKRCRFPDAPLWRSTAPPPPAPRLRAVSMEPLESRSEDASLTPKQIDQSDFVPNPSYEEGGGGEEEDEEEEEAGISRIQVPRQRYLQVSKAQLLDEILLKFFNSEDDDDADQFLHLSSCLDSILHAEHKSILEQMRSDYFHSHPMDDHETIEESDVPGSEEGDREDSSESPETVPNGKVSGLTADFINGNGRLGGYEEERELDESPLRFNYDLAWRNFLESSMKTVKRYSDRKSRLAVAARFQRAFMQLLRDAQFQELSATDLRLTSALNSDYLLTLPIYVDWKKASQSNAIIFRRGYATERQKGLLIVEKLDYLQSKLLRGILSIISKPLIKVGKLINKAVQDASETKEAQDWIMRIKRWLKELSLFKESYLNNEQITEKLLGVDELSEKDLPIWLAAQRAVSRYEGFLSEVGPRGRLLGKLLSRIGLRPPAPETPLHLNTDSYASEPYLRPTFLSRISLGDIWRPATRKYCGNDVWKMLKTSVSILLSKSILQEPSFQELILLYTKEADGSRNENDFDDQELQLKIYERIPIPDLPVVFPHKKLSFRIIDTVRLDLATIVGLSAFLINYKFVNILYSPSAILLDTVAVGALILYITRVALGYKQTWDRYQLLVNTTLYEKTLASGFGSVYFLLDASEQQQYKEAILTYAILLKAENGQAACHKQVADKCERFMYDVFKQKVEMPVDKALKTLVRLGLVTETPVNDDIRVQAIPCSKAYEALKDRWNGLLS